MSLLLLATAECQVPLSAWMLLQGKLEGEAKLGTCATWLDSLPDLSLQLFQLSRVASE